MSDGLDRIGRAGKNNALCIAGLLLLFCNVRRCSVETRTLILFW